MYKSLILDKKSPLRTILIDIVVLCATCSLFAICFNVFLAPANIYSGGCTGVAMILNRLFGLPMGIMVWVLNVPLVLTFTYFFGFRASIKGIVGITGTSLGMFLIETIKIDGIALQQHLQFRLGVIGDPGSNIVDAIAKYNETGAVNNPLLCAIFGGILLGGGLSLALSRGYTTGGTDLVSLLVRMKFKRLSTAKTIMIIDFTVVLIAAITAGIQENDIFSAILVIMFSLISIYMCSFVLDVMLGGFDKTKIAYVFSSKYQEISEAINTQLHRGVTILNGTGAYTKAETHMLLCAMKKKELHIFKRMVLLIDPNAFVIISDSVETIGQNFKSPKVDDVPIAPKNSNVDKAQKKQQQENESK